VTEIYGWLTQHCVIVFEKSDFVCALENYLPQVDAFIRKTLNG
jgi:hypothetical protein